jgi:DNA-binding transcriptional LysR family regulator
MRITLLTSNLQVALSGRFLTVLPDLTAAPAVARGDLWRLPPDVVPPIRVFVAHRPSLRADGAAAALVSRVADVIAGASRPNATR